MHRRYQCIFSIAQKFMTESQVLISYVIYHDVYIHIIMYLYLLHVMYLLLVHTLKCISALNGTHWMPLFCDFQVVMKMIQHCGMIMYTSGKIYPSQRYLFLFNVPIHHILYSLFLVLYPFNWGLMNTFVCRGKWNCSGPCLVQHLQSGGHPFINHFIRIHYNVPPIVVKSLNLKHE